MGILDLRFRICVTELFGFDEVTEGVTLKLRRVPLGKRNLLNARSDMVPGLGVQIWCDDGAVCI